MGLTKNGKKPGGGKISKVGERLLVSPRKSNRRGKSFVVARHKNRVNKVKRVNKKKKKKKRKKKKKKTRDPCSVKIQIP